MKKASELTAPEMIEAIKAEAVRESKDLSRMRGSKGAFHKGTKGAKIIENTPLEPTFRKHIVSLCDEPVSLSTFKNFDPTVRTTAGFYTLTYLPASDVKRNATHPFLIGQDLVRMRIYLAGPRDFRKVSEQIPELGWMRRWCPMLTNELFDLAATHPGIPFYFTPDWIGYAKMIRDKAEKAGIDLDGKPFVTYAASYAKQAELNEKYKLAPKKTKQDYESVLKRIEDEGIPQEDKHYV